MLLGFSVFGSMYCSDISAQHFRNLRRIFFSLVSFVCLNFHHANANESLSSAIVGTWTADVRFFDRTVRKKLGPLEARLEIEPDFTLKGHFGNSEMTPTRPTIQTSTQLQYQVLLKQALPGLPELRSPHLMVIVTLTGQRPIDADFHLKSRFGFDPKMRVGHFDIKQ